MKFQLFEDEFVIMPNHFHAIVWSVDLGQMLSAL